LIKSKIRNPKSQLPMTVALLLGLVGSFTHCAGMCSGITLLLSRNIKGKRSGMLFLQMGRIASYGVMGGLIGLMGGGLMQPAAAMDSHHATAAVSLPGGVQGGMALLAALVTAYMGLALLGRVPSPELLFVGWTRRWGGAMRWLTRSQRGGGLLLPLATGMLWGMLPCGLVLAGLALALNAGTFLSGALTMLAFGLGTWPMTMGMGLLVRRSPLWSHQLPRLRLVSGLVVMLFGAQLALRGLAAWGWLGHQQVGNMMLW